MEYPYVFSTNTCFYVDMINVQTHLPKLVYYSSKAPHLSGPNEIVKSVNKAAYMKMFLIIHILVRAKCIAENLLDVKQLLVKIIIEGKQDKSAVFLNQFALRGYKQRLHSMLYQIVQHIERLLSLNIYMCVYM